MLALQVILDATSAFGANSQDAMYNHRVQSFDFIGLAYYYGKNGALTGISVAAAQAVIGAPGFGQDAQNLRPFSGLQEGMVKLA